MNEFKFSKKIENLINPIEVGAIHFMYPFNKVLSKKKQSKLVEKSSKKYPYMGFVVDPYSYFICYEIEDVDYANSLIPDNFELIKSSVFEGDKPKYLAIFGCLNVHTSAFFGQRMEFYVIARDKKTDLLSWIIVEYDTNTLSYDKKGGIVDPNCKSCIITTNFDGNVIVDIVNKDDKRKLKFNSDIKNGVSKNLDQKLWLEGNFSIGYGKEISNNSDEVFGLKFNPKEVQSALLIEPVDINIIENTWYPGLFKKEPCRLVCFPYAQHFLADSPGKKSYVKTKEELIKAVKDLEDTEIQPYSIKAIKNLFIIGAIISNSIIILLFILLILK